MRPKKKAQSKPKTGQLLVRMDPVSRRCLTEAAALRQISVSDYVRTVTVAQARREVAAARERVIVLSPQEQLEFWNALCAEPALTDAQRALGAIMRGEA